MSIGEQSLDVLLAAAQRKEADLRAALAAQSNIVADLRLKIIERDDGIRIGVKFETDTGDVVRVSRIQLMSTWYWVRVQRRKKNGQFEDRQQLVFENWKNWKRLEGT